MRQVVNKKPKKASLRRTPQQDRSVESRDKILKGARSVLCDDGFERFSMRRVAAVSSVGVGTIYDYFPSGISILHLLLEKRLRLRLEIFDRTADNIPADARLAEFIDQYLIETRKAGFWTRYDIELQKAAQSDETLQSLLDWYEAETADRYMRAMKAAGSPWLENDLRTVAYYLISVSAQFEPGVIATGSKFDQQLTIDLVRQTYIAIFKTILRPRGRTPDIQTTE
ncbi:MAG: TetR/AcrR family transcriptional regulator [Parasphingopyxis sp.]